MLTIVSHASQSENVFLLSTFFILKKIQTRAVDFSRELNLFYILFLHFYLFSNFCYLTWLLVNKITIFFNIMKTSSYS